MDEHRSHWNEQQKEMEHALTRAGEHDKAIALCLRQHAMIHASEVSQSGLWSFDDELWDGLSVAAARRIPPKGEHSICWTIQTQLQLLRPVFVVNIFHRLSAN